MQPPQSLEAPALVSGHCPSQHRLTGRFFPGGRGLLSPPLLVTSGRSSAGVGQADPPWLLAPRQAGDSLLLPWPQPSPTPQRQQDPRPRECILHHGKAPAPDTPEGPGGWGCCVDLLLMADSL